ncbi:hypothetical protein HJC23_011580 [Cyclotella cryptica]|uniref:Uncharacterized protein n=1 Tax=Cyclotella cryptica TaxID=29204 RepID=A0ABD3QS49_9STRA
MSSTNINPLPLLANETGVVEVQDDTNTTDGTIVIKSIEIIRMTGTAVAIAIGFVQQDGSAPNYRLSAALLVFFLSGLTGLESLVFGKQSALAKKWPADTPYQRQTAMNNLAVAISMIIFLSLNASDSALASLMLTTTVFIALSSINHITTVIRDKLNGEEVAKIHFARFFFAVPLTAAVGFILGNWRPFAR